MFRLDKLLDKHIEAFIKTRLYSKRDQIINKAIATFENQHPNQPTDELKKLFEKEANRVYPMVDRSILHDRIQRAKFTFLATAIMTIVMIIATDSYTAGHGLVFASPLIMAFVSWAALVGTVGISYNQRIKGAMHSVADGYEKSLSELTLSPSADLNFDKAEDKEDTNDAIIEITMQNSSSYTIRNKLNITKNISSYDVMPELTVDPHSFSVDASESACSKEIVNILENDDQQSQQPRCFSLNLG